MKRTKIEKLHSRMQRVPHWLLAATCLILVLWLTLSPHPLGDAKIDFFFGIDKVAHCVMFMGLTLCFLFDAMRAKGWHILTLPVISIWSIISMLIGFFTEYMQHAMHVGRAFEYPDMVADAFGAIAGGALWILIGGTFRLTDKEIRDIEDKSLRGTSDVNRGD